MISARSAEIIPGARMRRGSAETIRLPPRFLGFPDPGPYTFLGPAPNGAMNFSSSPCLGMGRCFRLPLRRARGSRLRSN